MRGNGREIFHFILLATTKEISNTMKKIVVGECRTGKTRINVLSLINKHKGDIIFLSIKNELEYLNLQSEFNNRKISDINIVRDCTHGKNFILCNTEVNSFFTIERLLLDTNILNNKDMLLVIDEGISVFAGYSSCKMLEKLEQLYEKSCDVLITILTLDRLKKETNPINFEKVLSKWDIEKIEKRNL
ncbi:MAG: hypothetical protein K0R54_105 [Clostridiaceae bacterium]|jgi:hypothetical protein|nr:hypothetical protein [Clostridiaceae bacterium]